MSLESILSIAGSGIAASSNALAVISHNVANAGTPDYVRQRAVQSALVADNAPSGVRTGATRRDLDLQLQTATFAQNATVTGLQTTQTALSGIVAAEGSTGAGNDLSSLVGKLQDAFTTLAGDPGNQAQQSAVIGAAGRLAGHVTTLAGSIASARQGAQDDAVAAVADANAGLASIGTLSARIMNQTAAGQSTADLESQRDAALDALGKIMPVTVIRQASGDVTLYSQGIAIPTRVETGGAASLSLAAATLGTGAAATAAAPRLMLGGNDVTGAVTGGRLGADLTLRDATLPTYQAGLDEFAHTLAGRLDAQGLTLFTDGTGTLPAGGGTPAQSGYLGLSSTLQVNPVAVASPSVLRDGLSGSTPGAGSGRAGDASLIDRVLYAFTGESAAGVPQTAPATTGLGADGTVSLPYAAPATLGGFARALVGAMAGDANQAQGALDTETAVQSTLQGRLDSTSGVSIDQEMTLMVQVQNAYAANGRVVSAVQAMWSSLLAMVN